MLTRRFCRPLFSIFVDFDRADLAGARHMGAAAGLQIDALDLEQAHAPVPDRRLHRHGAHQLRLRRQLLVGDPARPHRMILADQAVELGRDMRLVERGIRQVEIEPALAVADLAAGDVAGARPRTADAGRCACASGGGGGPSRSRRSPSRRRRAARRPRRRDMQDVVRAVALDVSTIAIDVPSARRRTPVSPGCPPLSA